MRAVVSRALATRRAALSVVLALSPPPDPGGVGTRTLGVDFGLRRCGLAVSAGFAPLPLRILPCDDADAERAFEDLARRVSSVASGEGARQIVVGMPFNAAGEEGEQANVTRTFVGTLAQAASAFDCDALPSSTPRAIMVDEEMAHPRAMMYRKTGCESLTTLAWRCHATQPAKKAAAPTLIAKSV